MNSLHVEFFQHAVEQGAESEKAKRPVYKTEDYIRICIPGGKSVIERAVREEDKLEYAKKWEQFVAKRDQVGDGWPIDQWKELDIGRVMTLKAARVFTVEQIAALSDTQATDVLGLGAYELREKARAALQKEDPSIALKGENERLRADLMSTQAQIDELRKQIAAMQIGQDKPKKT